MISRMRRGAAFCSGAKSERRRVTLTFLGDLEHRPSALIHLHCHPERGRKPEPKDLATQGPSTALAYARFAQDDNQFSSKWELAVFGRRTYYVYMMMSSSRRALYTGVTGNLMTRVRQHKNHIVEGFCDKYNCTRLVYFEAFMYVKNAIAREKQIKGRIRAKKTRLIESMNPEYRDLASHWK